MVYAWLQRHPRLVTTVLVLAALASAAGYAGRHHEPALGITLALVQRLPIVWLRRRPLPLLALVTAATVAIILGWGFYDPLPLGIVLVGFAVAWLPGDSLGTGRRYVAALEERAERLEREREAEARRAAAEEQSRIARELHDVIAHSVSVMVVQAAAANDVFELHPERAREALRSIESTGREALAELRS